MVKKMVPLNDSLQELSVLAGQLNEETDGLNEFISDLEKKIGASKVGVTVWIDEMKLLDESAGELEGSKEGWYLGYTKIGDAWRIAVKRVNELYDTNREFVTANDLSDPMPLSKAPRIVRVESAPYLEKLVMKLAKRVREHIHNIQIAKQAAK